MYAVAPPDGLPDLWTHRVSGAGVDRGLTFRCRWMEVGAAESCLAGDQGAYLPHALDVLAAARAWAAPKSGAVGAVITIREGRRTDHEALLALWTGLGDYHRSIERIRPLRWALRPTETRLRLLQETWSDPSRRGVFVAEGEDGLVGFVRVSLSEKGPCPAAIDTLFVTGPRRGQRIGTRLLERALTWCRERGAAEVSVEFIAPNEPARAFYERAGFQPLLVTHVRRL